ncbi:hypothetical protein B0J11DRAFT_433670, partial [Dendryphion nanum]
KCIEIMISTHETKSYTNFSEINELRKFIQNSTGWRIEIMLQRSMLRAFDPKAESTPVHYDESTSIGESGPPTSLTAYIPISYMSLEDGKSIYPDGFNDIGKKSEAAFTRNARR